MSRGGEQPVDRGPLAPDLSHPFKLAIFEALEWIERPLSASQLACVVDQAGGVSRVAYHLRKLADGGVLELISERPVGGSFESFFCPAVTGNHPA